MSELAEFSAKIESRLAAAKKEPSWPAGEAERYMAEFAPRWEKFEQFAAHLTAEVIVPRVKKLTGYFTNAKVSDGGPPGQCECWFSYRERFPNNARIRFACEHDQQLTHFVVVYDLYIRPVFVKYNDHDRMTVDLSDVEDTAVAQWVETRLLEFLDTYLTIDRGLEEFEEETVVDPVCGMRMRPSKVASRHDHLGHPYYFCSDACAEAFTQTPERYITFEPW